MKALIVIGHCCTGQQRLGENDVSKSPGERPRSRPRRRGVPVRVSVISIASEEVLPSLEHGVHEIGIPRDRRGSDEVVDGIDSRKMRMSYLVTLPIGQLSLMRR